MGEKIEMVDAQVAQNSDQQEEKKSYAYGNEAFRQKNTFTTYQPIQRGII